MANAHHFSPASCLFELENAEKNNGLLKPRTSRTKIGSLKTSVELKVSSRFTKMSHKIPDSYCPIGEIRLETARAF